MPPIFYSPIFKLLGLYPISNYWVFIQQIEVEMIVHKNKINQKVRLPDILYDFYKIVRDWGMNHSHTSLSNLSLLSLL